MDQEQIRVLMIEDLQMAQKLAEKSFEQLNCQLDIVSSAAKAFEQMMKVKYDIIFADIHLPDIDGLEFVQAIRSIESEHLPIVAVTAMPNEALANKAKNHGCDDFMQKPLNMAAIKHMLNKHIDGMGWHGQKNNGAQFMTEPQSQLFIDER